MAKINARIPVPHGTTAAELIAELEKVPGDSIIGVGVTPGDRPWESGEQYVTARYET